MIKITCKAHTNIPLSQLKWFQGKLAETTSARLQKLKTSLEEKGIFMAFSVWDDGEQLNIVDGHARKLALDEMGYDGKVPVNFVLATSYEDAKERVLLARSQTNTTTEEGLYDWCKDLDWEKVSAMIDLPGIEIERFADKYLSNGKDEEADVGDLIDRAEELNKKWKVKEGDLWQLGRHRLLCGTVFDGVDEFSDGADMIYTDPPYGKGGYAGRSGKFKPIRGDNENPKKYYDIIPSYIKERYIWGDFKCLRILRDDPRDVIVWRKNNFGMGRGYRGQYELCFYFGGFSGSDSDVWDAPRIKSDYHPTEKPVEFAIRAMNNSVKYNAIVVDYYAGAGSTLIACEVSGRSCRAIELEQDYCAVSLERWSQYTGQTPERINGR